MVNHDSNTFTMWQANPSTSSNLISVMSEKVAEACGNVTGVVQPGATATGESAESSSSESSTQTSPGVIAGATVGALAFLAAMGLAVFFLLRRKRRQGESQPRHELFNEKPGMDPQVLELQEDQSHITDRMLPSNSVYAQELSNSVFSQELDSAKPPSELPHYNTRSELDGRDNLSMRGNSQTTYEMDGRAYSFE